jgi:hypothetical protein
LNIEKLDTQHQALIQLMDLEFITDFNNKENTQQPTSGIKHWGLIGYSSLMARADFCNAGYRRSPYSPTFHTPSR